MKIPIFSVVESSLSKFFREYGKLVARVTPLFLAIPVFTTFIALCIVLFRFIPLPLMRDTIYLYTPTTGQAWQDKQNLAELFPLEDKDLYFAWRRFDLEWMGFVIVTRKDGKSVLDEDVFFEIVDIWSNILDVIVYDYNSYFVYNNLCVLTPKVLPENYCLQNPLFVLIHTRPSLLKTLTYPNYVVPSWDDNDKDIESRSMFLGEFLFSCYWLVLAPSLSTIMVDYMVTPYGGIF